ncbi:MAG: hypothetical protein VXB01_06145 [Opitutae bacterium]
MKFTIAAAALVVVGLLFMDTPQRKNARCVDTMNDAQVEEAIMLINHLRSPLPFER